MDAFFSRVILLIALLWVNPSGAQDVGCDPRIPVTTNEYVSAFWPLWLSINQFELEPANTLIGPETITPVYQVRGYCFYGISVQVQLNDLLNISRLLLLSMLTPSMHLLVLT